jgi:heme A synthase
MSTDQTSLESVMNENNVRHAALRGAYVDLLETRSRAEMMLEDGGTNVVEIRLKTESAHVRQRVWYIILALTVLLFSKFALQSRKSATNLFSTAILAAIVVLVVTGTASISTATPSWASGILVLIIALIVALYIAHHVIHRI